MDVLERVFQIYGTRMYNMRFLLIPAGGYSQRLPNLSVLGKLFSPLPFKENGYQMLDLILATYLPFLTSMPPGVFLASSDAIISYSLDDNDSWSFKTGGFTALAHPSPVVVGTTHGVYVLPNNVGTHGSSFMSECLRVLQKPTVKEMEENGAIVRSFSNSGEEEDTVFSDSAFFFDHTITKKLIKFYQSNKPLKCEISSYGDFLQPLGHLASPSYIVNYTDNEHQASLQSALYAQLHGTPLSVMVLKNSNFHHLGTMQEYVDSLCGGNKFSEDFPIAKFSFVSLSTNFLAPTFVDGTIIHSVIHSWSVIPESSVVEYCDIHIAMDVGSNCIISNVQVDGFPIQRVPHKVPDNTMLHTVILKEGFVTVAFGLADDIKKSHPVEDYLEVEYFGKKLGNFIKMMDPIFDTSVTRVSLWTAKLFRVCSTPEDSFKRTLEMVLCVDECIPNHSNFTLDRSRGKWVSMAQILLLLKDTQAMVKYQKKLFDKINKQKEIQC
ncbi:hypothetical protein JTE90_018647 [Oedothorax gibbosus]|uniref:GDP-fucose pyrophosphorylase domain-containing protein n=1 Tax=Oedothorax gibbosus TaxID=931172 RepID=A0AAV6TMG4_9ARAC|nr:hypothetical protein JTE90_018647 [Oedothorax gibbosus]